MKKILILLLIMCGWFLSVGEVRGADSGKCKAELKFWLGAVQDNIYCKLIKKENKCINNSVPNFYHVDPIGNGTPRDFECRCDCVSKKVVVSKELDAAAADAQKSTEKLTADVEKKILKTDPEKIGALTTKFQSDAKKIEEDLKKNTEEIEKKYGVTVEEAKGVKKDEYLKDVSSDIAKQVINNPNRVVNQNTPGGSPDYSGDNKPAMLPKDPLAGTFSNLGDILSKLLPYVFVFAGLCLLVMLILGGITLMTAGGNPDKAKAGYGKIVGGVIGFLIIFISYFVVQIVEVMLGIKIL